MTSASTTIRVPATTHDRLRRLAREERRPIGQVIAALLVDFARLEADPEAWADYRAELSASNCTLSDGLGDQR